MKNMRPLLLLALCAATMFAACKKDEKKNSSTQTVSNPHEGLVKMRYRTDAKPDTMFYYYDDKGRTVAMITPSLGYSDSFFYSGNTVTEIYKGALRIHNVFFLKMNESFFQHKM